MKTNLFSALMLFMSTTFFAQPYGENFYPHSASILTSGSVVPTSWNPGFTMTGYVPTVVNGGYSFFVDRTDAGGVFNSNSWEFQNTYQLMGDNNCNANPTQALNCYGVSIIHTSLSSPSANFVVVGALDYGIFFATLNSAGAPVTTTAYRFTPSSTYQNVTKPVIVESVVNPGTYFIAGSYGNSNIYVLHVGASGGVIAQTNSISTNPVYPLDIIESPYGTPFTNAVIVVGYHVDPTERENTYALLFNQSLTTYIPYSYDDGAFNNQGFTSIKRATSVALCTLTDGFVVGGWNDGSSVTGKALICRTDKVTNLWWNTTIQGSFDPNCGKVVDVIERKNIINNYEYYGVGVSSVGTVIYKLDHCGVPFGTTYVGNTDEFAYYAGSVPEDFSFYGNTAATDIGLHIFGNKASTAGDYYSAESYFSGETGCNAPGNIGNTDATPLTIGLLPVLTSDFDLYPCTFGINYTNSSGFQSNCGPNASVGAPATNARVTGLNSSKKDQEIFLGPNPFFESTVLSVKDSDKNVDVRVLNVLGQEINCKLAELRENGVRKIKITFPTDSPQGIYNVMFQVNGKQNTVKIEYLK
jgi:hypothetical protein